MRHRSVALFDRLVFESRGRSWRKRSRHYRMRFRAGQLAYIFLVLGIAPGVLMALSVWNDAWYYFSVACIGCSLLLMGIAHIHGGLDALRTGVAVVHIRLYVSTRDKYIHNAEYWFYIQYPFGFGVLLALSGVSLLVFLALRVVIIPSPVGL